MKKLIFPFSLLARRNADDCAQENDIFARADKAMTGGDKAALMEIGDELVALSCKWSYLVEPSLIVAEHLLKFSTHKNHSPQNDFNDVFRVIGFFSYLCQNAPAGSDLQQRAMVGFTKAVGGSTEGVTLSIRETPAKLGEENPTDPSLPSKISAHKFVQRHLAA